jgi:hypothetical protein
MTRRSLALKIISTRKKRVLDSFASMAEKYQHTGKRIEFRGWRLFSRWDFYTDELSKVSSSKEQRAKLKMNGREGEPGVS